VPVSLLSVIVDCCRRGAIAFCAAAVVAIGAAACGGGPSTAAPTSSTAAPTSSAAAPTSSAAAPTSSAAAAGSPATAGSGPHFPAQLFGLNKNTGRAGKQVAREVSSELSYTRSILHSPKTALYGTESSPDIIVFVSSWTGAVAHRAADAAFDKSTAAGAAAGAGSTDAQPFPAGPHGGVLKCGHVTHNGERGLVCVWADKLTFGGVTYIFGSASNPSDAASKTNQIRSAIGT
jgi:hypothetical protein